MKRDITILFLSLFLFVGCMDKTSSNTDKNDTRIVTTHTEEPQEKAKTTVVPSSVSPSQNDEIEETLPRIVEDNVSEEVEDNTSNETIVLAQIIKKRDSNESEIVKEWYIRLVVEDTNNSMKISNTQLGQLDRIDTIQSYALKAIAPFVARYLDVVFNNPAHFEAGEYKSIFHTVDTEADSWDFTVKSYDGTANMILGFRGLYALIPYTDTQDRLRYHENYIFMHPLLKRMTLLDIDENREVAMIRDNNVNEYLFNMNGVTERHFRWKFYMDVPTLAPKSMPKMSRMIKIPDRLKAKRLEDIDMNHPPKFEVLNK